MWASGRLDVEHNEKARRIATRNSITIIRFEVLPHLSLSVTFTIIM